MLGFLPGDYVIYFESGTSFLCKVTKNSNGQFHDFLLEGMIVYITFEDGARWVLARTLLNLTR
jgi:hypothetical protein